MCTMRWQRQENLQYWPPCAADLFTAPIANSSISSSPSLNRLLLRREVPSVGLMKAALLSIPCYPQNRQLAAALQTCRQNCQRTRSTLLTNSPNLPIAYLSHQCCWWEGARVLVKRECGRSYLSATGGAHGDYWVVVSKQCAMVER